MNPLVQSMWKTALFYKRTKLKTIIYLWNIYRFFHIHPISQGSERRDPQVYPCFCSPLGAARWWPHAFLDQLFHWLYFNFYIWIVDRLLRPHPISQWSERPDPQVHSCDRSPLGAARCWPPAFLDQRFHRFHCNVFYLKTRNNLKLAIKENYINNIVLFHSIIYMEVLIWRLSCLNNLSRPRFFLTTTNYKIFLS